MLWNIDSDSAGYCNSDGNCNNDGNSNSDVNCNSNGKYNSDGDNGDSCGAQCRRYSVAWTATCCKDSRSSLPAH